jgi:hypothetical protein
MGSTDCTDSTDGLRANGSTDCTDSTDGLGANGSTDCTDSTDGLRANGSTDCTDSTDGLGANGSTDCTDSTDGLGANGSTDCTDSTDGLRANGSTDCTDSTDGLGANGSTDCTDSTDGLRANGSTDCTDSTDGLGANGSTDCTDSTDGLGANWAQRTSGSMAQGDSGWPRGRAANCSGRWIEAEGCDAGGYREPHGASRGSGAGNHQPGSWNRHLPVAGWSVRLPMALAKAWVRADGSLLDVQSPRLRYNSHFLAIASSESASKRRCGDASSPWRIAPVMGLFRFRRCLRPAVLR